MKQYKLIREIREEAHIDANSLEEAKAIAESDSPADRTIILSEEWEELEAMEGAER